MGSVNMDIVYALAAYSAPLIGFVVWLTPFSLTAGAGGWDFPKYFMLGAYMAATGFVITLLLWIAAGAHSPARAALWRTTKLQGLLLAGSVLLFASAHAAGVFAGHPSPPVNNPPSHVMTAMTVAFVGAGFLLPVVEVGWILSGILSVFQGPRTGD